MQNLKVCLVQANLAWEDKKTNRDRLKSIVLENPHADLYVLPEMFTTGFTMNTELSESPDNSETLEWMVELAKKMDAVVCGSFIVADEGVYNRFYAVNKDGSIAKYDKRHLFRMAGEDAHYSAGTGLEEFNCNGWVINPFICYDLRFPVWSRNTNNGELMMYVANWPEARKSHWRSLLIARAIENQCYVIGVNRVGKDGNGITYSGNSMVVSPKGEVIDEIVDKEGIITLELSKEVLQKYLKEFPAYRDRDDFEIK